MISKVKNIAVLFVGLLLPGFVAADVKIAVVDMQKALTASKEGAEAQKKYEAEVKKAQSDIDVKKTEFEKMQEAVKKQRSTLNEKALREKQDQLISMEKDLKRSFQDEQDLLRRKNAELVGGLVKRARKIVDELGKSEGYTVVLEKNVQGVLYSDAANDITDKVIQQLNK